ncbi:hypothetical protein RFI_29169 [Reticulomyxa filosa]|uniref:Uncharacterized protein n=1 Tax=Reticulomyxa filosa TaxID=46433 RepID=X6M5B1_RETFI|nr:hypothetical protein RFI_29169 [Reticulomyxa filosa]|eukprot:ETO08220.1 hypothetical protein RFI_29169 [Reticulomyxa filosa]
MHECTNYGFENGKGNKQQDTQERKKTRLIRYQKEVQNNNTKKKDNTKTKQSKNPTAKKKKKIIRISVIYVHGILNVKQKKIKK